MLLCFYVVQEDIRRSYERRMSTLYHSFYGRFSVLLYSSTGRIKLHVANVDVQNTILHYLAVSLFVLYLFYLRSDCALTIRCRISHRAFRTFYCFDIRTLAEEVILYIFPAMVFSSNYCLRLSIGLFAIIFRNLSAMYIL